MTVDQALIKATKMDLSGLEGQLPYGHYLKIDELETKEQMMNEIDCVMNNLVT